MNTALNKTSAVKGSTPGEFLIGLRLAVPAIDPNPLYLACPENNWQGMLLADRLFRHALELGGVTCIKSYAAGPLNRSVFLFDVAQLGPALEILRTELAALHLLALAQICYWDEREGIWRCVFPSTAPATEFERALSPESILSMQSETARLSAEAAKMAAEGLEKFSQEGGAQ